MSQVIINVAEQGTELITNTQNICHSLWIFLPRKCVQKLQSLTTICEANQRKKVHCCVMKKGNVIFKAVVAKKTRDRDHPYMFTFPSCVWTSWSTGFSLCPGCLCSICNVTNIHIHQYLQWVVIGVPNVSTAYVATFLSRLLMSLSKGLFAWALMRHSWALWYSCSPM